MLCVLPLVYLDFSKQMPFQLTGTASHSAAPITTFPNAENLAHRRAAVDFRTLPLFASHLWDLGTPESSANWDPLRNRDLKGKGVARDSTVEYPRMPIKF